MFEGITRTIGNTIVEDKSYTQAEKEAWLMKIEKAAGFAGNQKEVSNDNRNIFQDIKTTTRLLFGLK